MSSGSMGRHGEDNRLFVDAVLWIARAGAPWRDLPPAFGNWNSVFQRFRRWPKKGLTKSDSEEKEPWVRRLWPFGPAETPKKGRKAA